MSLKVLLLESLKKNQDKVAINVLNTEIKISYKELYYSAKELATKLAAIYGDLQGKVIGLMMRNTPEWIVVDLAILLLDAVEVPVPIGFSTEQVQHLLANAEFCLIDNEEAWEKTSAFLQPDQIVDVRKKHELDGTRRNVAQKPQVIDNPDVIKVIHTSGTTSNPKGVMIRGEALSTLLEELTNRLGMEAAQNYLSLVPFSLLIEQVSGIYLPLLNGGTVNLLPPDEEPLTGGNSRANEYLEYIRLAKPTFITVPPSIVESLNNKTDELLAQNRDIVEECFGGTLPLIACGGAPVSVSVLKALQEKGIPVFEGYGLSENSSVVSWNYPQEYKFGTSGKPLSYIQIRNDADGELLIKSPTMFYGYLAEDVSSCELTEDGYLNTGDIGFLDEDGFLRIVGRKKNILINSSGRNISPEWVEGVYRSSPYIDDIVVFGEGREFVGALIVPSEMNERIHEVIEAEIQRLSPLLPDYAQVKKFFLFADQLTTENNFMTVTGRPRRVEIQEHFKNQIEMLFN